AVLPRRVHQHGDRGGGRHQPVPGRLARAPASRGLRLDLVLDQAELSVFRLPVAALDAVALPLRPADVVRLEAAAAAGHRQPARERGGGALLWAFIMASSTS